MQSFTNDKARYNLQQKMIRQYDKYNEEWIAFLSALFPLDTLASFQKDKILLKKNEKKIQNKLYRSSIRDNNEYSETRQEKEKVKLYLDSNIMIYIKR